MSWHVLGHKLTVGGSAAASQYQPPSWQFAASETSEMLTLSSSPIVYETRAASKSALVESISKLQVNSERPITSSAIAVNTASKSDVLQLG